MVKIVPTVLHWMYNSFSIQRDMREMDRTLGTWTDLMTFNSTIIISWKMNKFNLSIRCSQWVGIIFEGEVFLPKNFKVQINQSVLFMARNLSFTVCWNEVKVAVLCARQYMPWNLLLIIVLNNFWYFKHQTSTRICSEAFLKHNWRFVFEKSKKITTNEDNNVSNMLLSKS